MWVFDDGKAAGPLVCWSCKPTNHVLDPHVLWRLRFQQAFMKELTLEKKLILGNSMPSQGAGGIDHILWRSQKKPAVSTVILELCSSCFPLHPYYGEVFCHAWTGRQGRMQDASAGETPFLTKYLSFTHIQNLKQRLIHTIRKHQEQCKIPRRPKTDKRPAKIMSKKEPFYTVSILLYKVFGCTRRTVLGAIHKDFYGEIST